MGSLNKVMIIGNLGRDAEVRYTPSGTAVANFNLAANEVWFDKTGQKQEKTEWIRCVLWGDRVESLSEYLVKGKQVFVEGKLQTRQWDDKDGNKRYMTEVNVFNVQLLGSRGSSNGPRRDENAPMEQAESANSQPVDDDIPF